MLQIDATHDEKIGRKPPNQERREPRQRLTDFEVSRHLAPKIEEQEAEAMHEYPLYIMDVLALATAIPLYTTADHA
jgi:hypothetical protein